MSGKRQHYIPRFLQRGFLYDSLEAAERTWLHRRGAPPRLVGIRDVGVSEYFYSKLNVDGMTTLDDLITRIEGNLDSEIKAISVAPIGEQVDAGAAARLSAHLLMRTAHIRSVFAQAASQMLDGAALLLADTAAIRELLGVDSFEGQAPISKALDEALKKLPVESLQLPRPLAQRIVRFLAREQFETLFDGSRPEIAQILTWIAKEIPALVRSAHNQALETSNSERWEEFLRTLYWRTQAAEGAVLPDCIVLARESDQKYKPFVLSERDKVEIVVLPLAHDRLLVGSRRINSQIEMSGLNAASAACSDSFFISRSLADGSELSKHIGQRSARVIKMSVSNALSNLKPVRDAETGSVGAAGSVTEPQTSSSLTFSISCSGYSDPDRASRVGEVAKAVVQQLTRMMPLSTLDGMTFAVDYPKAIQDLDRGDRSIEKDQSCQRDYGREIASRVMVVRDGAEKTHIVVDSVVADGLLSDNPDEWANALQILIAMLARIAHTARYESRLVRQPTTPPPEIDSFLYKSISAAPCDYFAARESAFTNRAAGERYATLVVDSLTSARKTIEGARLDYRVNEDIDGFLEVALPAISYVLSHAAEWLGHRDGLPDEENVPGNSLLSDLRTLDLDNWLELFGRDLRALYAGEGQFTSGRLLELSRHVERLLWTVQTFPWPMENGSVYVSIPWGQDAELLKSRSLSSPTESAQTE